LTIFYSSGSRTVYVSHSDIQDYRAILLDVGLAQSALGLDLVGWFLNPSEEFINKGALVEAFVGQEMLAYGQPHSKNTLYYWHKESTAQQAEIDYLVQLKGEVIPVEVKAGLGRTIKSLHYFLEKHPNSSHGIRFSTQNYSIHERVYSWPLYAIAHVLGMENPDIKQAIQRCCVENTDT